VANTAAGLGTAATLKINEWMADPLNGSDWFELFNSGSQPVPLAGFSFTTDLTKKTMSLVPPLSFIGSGFVQFRADDDPSAGADHVRFKLSKLGESIGLYSPAGTLVDAITFGQQLTGVSQGRFPDGSANIINFAATSSPAESNYLPLQNVVVNEILTHTDPPFEDAVEFYNPTASPASIGGWFLSNTSEDLKKFRIPDGTVIPAHGFRVFYENQFNGGVGSAVPFTFNSAHGDSVFLSEVDSSSNLTGYRAAALFDAAAHNVSFGRHTNSLSEVEYVAMAALSFGINNPSTVEQFRTGAGAINPGPLIGPVVISEIMYYPPMIGGTEDDTQNEFIELHNISAANVPLFDPAAPTNNWQLHGGIDFVFPQDVTLQAGGYLLLVNFDPVFDVAALAEFRTKYNVSQGIPLFGPYTGRLSNSAETLALFKPDPPQVFPHPDAGFVPYVLVEKVEYQSTSPWPATAAGSGGSIQRLNTSGYGNEPTNWFAATPTAGAPNTTNPSDTNGDGLPDAWQLQYFNSITDPNAAPGADPDGDGFNNLQEYLTGTDPTNSGSYLRIDGIQIAGNSISLEFNAIAGKTYSIFYSIDLGSWQRLSDVPAQSQTGPMVVNDPTAGSAPVRFYRLITPKSP
jgi:hypothetical protein